MGFEQLFPLTTEIRIDLPFHQWIRNFDSEFYRTHGHYNGVADLTHLRDDELLKHFIARGWYERRSYNRFIYSFLETEFYFNKYSDLGFGNLADAVAHWNYYGVYEKKIPNSVTQELLDAPIHLFQMGKVGSKSIECAMRNAGYSGLIPHLHWANEAILSYADCFFSYEEILSLPRLRPVKFISGIREPIGRAISGLFESAVAAKSSMSIDYINEIVESGVVPLSLFMTEMIDPVLRWFDHEYYCGLNVYDQSFDVTRGYGVVENEAASVFLYRLDKLANCWPQLGDYVGLPLKVTSINQSLDKYYDSSYQAVLSKAKFSRDFLEYVLGSRYCQTFFNKSERKEIFVKYLV
jgi:hypothetical protein